MQVASAITQGRADWGVAIESVAKEHGLQFIPVKQEAYDFVIPESRKDRPEIRVFQELLSNPQIQKELQAVGCELNSGSS